MDNFHTLLELLFFRATNQANQVAFTFLEQVCTFSELWQKTNLIANSLLHDGLEKSEPVILLFPNSEEFFPVFYGIQLAGGIAIPLKPDSDIIRVKEIANHCGCRRVLIPDFQQDRFLAHTRSSNLQIIEIGNLAKYSQKMIPMPEVRPDDIAFIQYTSGSTGDPKGVMLSHHNLLTNVQQMIIGMEITKEDIFISWLPVYHDMGLILMTMAPFLIGAKLHLLETNLRNLRVWLETIRIKAGTFTAAPDFAYRLATRSVANHASDYKLSTLRVALNAAEPVRVCTIQEFERTFQLRNVMTAGYGLADATVGLCMTKPGATPRIDAHGLVSVGKSFRGVEIVIIKEQEITETGEVGEIAFRSTANFRGYINNPEANQEVKWKYGFLLSSDLGYLDREGNLTIVGRKKNIIKVAGETIAARRSKNLLIDIPSCVQRQS